eukprot:4629608-Pleurochrysis_carterae.AAC.1
MPAHVVSRVLEPHRSRALLCSPLSAVCREVGSGTARADTELHSLSLFQSRLVRCRPSLGFTLFASVRFYSLLFASIRFCSLLFASIRFYSLLFASGPRFSFSAPLTIIGALSLSPAPRPLSRGREDG